MKGVINIDELLKAIMEADKLVNVGEEVYESVRNLGETPFLMVLGGVVDRWAAEHGKTQEETFEMMQKIASAQQMVHAEIGPYGQTERALRDMEQNVN